MAWTKPLLRIKALALAVHLGISALIFLPFLYLIWFHWFPPPLFFTDGGWQGLRIMLFVDLFIGPSLTFIIFNPAKSRRELTLDLSCIALVQGIALAYGGYTVAQKRLEVMALSDGVFHVVSHKSFTKQETSPADWAQLGDGPLYWTFVRKPRSKEEQDAVVLFGAMQGTAAHELLFLYEPLARHSDELRHAAIDPDKGTGDAEVDERLRQFRSDHPQAVFFVRHEGSYRDAILAFDDHNQMVGAIKLAAHP